MFKWIHPSVVNVYIYAIQLNDLGLKLNELGENIPKVLKAEIDIIADKFVLAEKQALDILGSRDVLNQQLTFFEQRAGKA